MVRDLLASVSSETTDAAAREIYLLKRGQLVAFLEDRDGGLRQCADGTKEHLKNLIQDMTVHNRLTLIERVSLLFDARLEDILIKHMNAHQEQLIHELISQMGMSQNQAKAWLDNQSVHVLNSYKERIQITPRGKDPYAYNIISDDMGFNCLEQLELAFRPEKMLRLLLDQGPLAEIMQPWRTAGAESCQVSITHDDAMTLIKRLREFYRLSEQEITLYHLFEVDDESQIKSVDRDTLALRLQVKMLDLLSGVNAADEKFVGEAWKKKVWSDFKPRVAELINRDARVHTFYHSGDLFWKKAGEENTVERLTLSEAIDYDILSEIAPFQLQTMLIGASEEEITRFSEQDPDWLTDNPTVMDEETGLIKKLNIRDVGKLSMITTFLKRLDNDGRMKNAMEWIINNRRLFERIIDTQGNPLINLLLETPFSSETPNILPLWAVRNMRRDEVIKFFANMDSDGSIKNAIEWITHICYPSHAEFFKIVAQFLGNPLITTLLQRISRKELFHLPPPDSGGYHFR